MDHGDPRQRPKAGPPRPLAREDAAELQRDEAVVARARAGDRAAAEAIYRAHVRGVERLLARLVGPGADLEDLVQVTFLEALRSLTAFRGEARLSTWLARIAVHVAHHHLRSSVRRRARLVLVADPDDAPDAPDPAAAPERMESRLDLERLYAALDRLPAARRVALLLHLACGHSVDEVAALTGAGRFATRARLALGRRQLRQLVAADPALREILDDTGGGTA